MIGTSYEVLDKTWIQWLRNISENWINVCAIIDSLLLQFFGDGEQSRNLDVDCSQKQEDWDRASSIGTEDNLNIAQNLSTMLRKYCTSENWRNFSAITDSLLLQCSNSRGILSSTVLRVERDGAALLQFWCQSLAMQTDHDHAADKLNIKLLTNNDINSKDNYRFRSATWN